MQSGTVELRPADSLFMGAVSRSKVCQHIDSYLCIWFFVPILSDVWFFKLKFHFRVIVLSWVVLYQHHALERLPLSSILVVKCNFYVKFDCFQVDLWYTCDILWEQIVDIMVKIERFLPYFSDIMFGPMFVGCGCVCVCIDHWCSIWESCGGKKFWKLFLASYWALVYVFFI